MRVDHSHDLEVEVLGFFGTFFLFGLTVHKNCRWDPCHLNSSYSSYL